MNTGPGRLRWLANLPGRLTNRDGALRGGIRAIRLRWKIPIAMLLRRHSRFDSIVGVTGSVGKSTTTRLIAAALGAEHVVHAGAGINTPDGIRRTFLGKPRNARIWVQEISGHQPEAMRDSLAFVRPTVGVVTTIGMDHITNFRSLEATAESKAQLVQGLPDDGLAILNADDPLVAAMAESTKAKVITYGARPDAAIRLLSCSSSFPDRLVVSVRIGKEDIDVRTRLIGKRWATSVLAAIATASALGVPPAKAADLIGSVEPARFKDDVSVASGITFIADTHKAPYWTIESSVEIVAAARAPRKIMIIGTLSDYRGSARPKYQAAARAALEAAEIVIFYGPQSERVRRMKPDYEDRLFSFETFDALMDFLKRTLRREDLVYIKASGVDHIERVVLDYEKPISCRVTKCGKLVTCDECKYLHRARGHRKQ